MIKFFRKIRHQLLSENKFSKYLLYAFGEIILVVIGILIALQVNNWNQNRLNNQKEIEILTGTKEELKSLIKRLEFYADFNKSGQTLSRKVLNFNRSNAKKQTMDTLLNGMTMVHVFDKGGGFLETLIYSGKLELIRDNRIRKELSRWPDLLEDIHTNDLSYRDFVWHEIVPFLAEFGIPEAPQDTLISDTYLDLLDNEQFLALLRLRYGMFRAASRDHQKKADTAKKTLNLINAYLKDHNLN